MIVCNLLTCEKMEITPTCKHGIESEKTQKLNSEMDSSISMSFDSSIDCGYKSEELSSSLKVKQLQSNEAFQHSKIDKNIRFDSGLGIDSGLGTEYASQLSDESCTSNVSKVSPNDKDSECRNETISWQSIFTQDKDGDTLLHLAIVEARSDVIFPLMNMAPHPDFLDICNDFCQAPLHLATLTGKSSVVRRLVVAGAILDIQDRNGNTPLHVASRNGDLDCVQAILEPIRIAELKEAQCCYKTYVQNNDLSHLINLKNFEGQTCIHLAASGGFRKVLECLYDHGADVNDREGKNGKTPLHYVVENGKYDLVCLLLVKCHANPLVQNYSGQSSCKVAFALRRKHPHKLRLSIIEVLQKHTKWEPSSDSEDSLDDDE